MLFTFQHWLTDVIPGLILCTMTGEREEIAGCVNQLKLYKVSFFPGTICDWIGLPTEVTDISDTEEFRVVLDTIPATFFFQL